MLLPHHTPNRLEAGCDEAGRGCLSGPVFAAAVIFPPGYSNADLNDSKKLKESARDALRKQIEEEALCWEVASFSVEEIDKWNIFQSSYRAMHRALDALAEQPEFLLIDGKYFVPYGDMPYECVIKGDGKYQSIAAAGILAKTHRDEYMRKIHVDYPQYSWNSNAGYPTKAHRAAIEEFGATEHHRKSFRLLAEGKQYSLFGE
ncbi:MAG: ribonuclease HII [Neolewinella sp.]|jgi:ribonuclease HII